MKKYTLLTLGVLSLIAIIFAVQNVKNAKANPLFFSTGIQSSTSTTSPKFIPSGGTATSTVVYDSFLPNGSATTGARDAVVLLQMAASTTPGTAFLNVQVQYASGFSGINCSTNETQCDWYEDAGNNFNFATTSKNFDLTASSTYTYAYASSTPDKRASSIAGFATSTRAFRMSTPTRYSRLVFYSPVGATSLSYWVEIVPIKERAE